MKYFIISVAVAGISFIVQQSGEHSDVAINNNNAPQMNSHSQNHVCMTNISAGTVCHPSVKGQQEFVMVRGQPLPL